MAFAGFFDAEAKGFQLGAQSRAASVLGRQGDEFAADFQGGQGLGQGVSALQRAGRGKDDRLIE